MAINLGELADAIYAKGLEIDKAAAKVKELEVEQRAMEERMLNEMKAAGTDIIRGNAATVSISETTRAKIDDFEKFIPWLYRTKSAHLFERRIAAVAYRELMESRKGKAIPGLSEFTHERLNIRKKA